MTNEEFNKVLKKHFDEMNSVGLGELMLFSRGIEQFVDNKNIRSRLMNAIVDICGGFQTNARSFVKLISYEDFKKRRNISEVAALGLRLYLLYQCGVNWLSPDKKIKGI
jgi:hypothetical protein